MTCPASQTYTECGSSCISSCSDVLLVNNRCVEECVEGCSCPKGMVMSDNIGSCVPREKCGCLFGNKTISDGTSVMNQCNTWYVRLIVNCSM